MRKLVLALVMTLISLSAVAGNDGLVTMRSANDVPTTVTRLINVLKEKNMTVFKVVDHAKGAEKVGLKLRPTTVVIFGNPKVGTLLMQCGQSAGIDLPMKMLVRQDPLGKVWITYNDPDYLAGRHGIKGCTKVRKKMAGAQRNFAMAAARKAP